MSWMPRKKVLVPTDFSESSVDAIQAARELVETDADLTVLHVLEPLEYTAPASLFGDFAPEARTSRATKFLDEFLQRHELAGLHCVIAIGNPGLKITEFASENGVELIVLPSHGHSGLKRILLGSVAERVLRHAECPVLVLRRMDRDE